MMGSYSDGRMNISARAKSFGVNDDFAKSIGLDPKKVGDAQAVQSLVNELVVGKIGAGGFPSNNFRSGEICNGIAQHSRANRRGR